MRPLVIFFQGGAQSPYEFVSPLTQAPSEMRGEQGVMRCANGDMIDDRWKEFAKVAHKTSVIHSLDSGNTEHDGKYIVGDTMKQAEKLSNGWIPYPHIRVPSIWPGSAKIHPGSFLVGYDEKQNAFRPPLLEDSPPSLGMRYELLRSLELPLSGTEKMEKNRDLAASLLLGGNTLKKPYEKAQKAEERYGTHPIGKAAALAVEMAKAGAGITFLYNESGDGWDSHVKIKEKYDALIPPTDQALAQLILDSRRYGFTLLCTTEHGRTNLINQYGGRDHSTVGYAVLAGEGIQEGSSYGSLDKRGNIRDNGVRGKELMTTALHACGLSQDRSMTINQILK